VRLVPSASHHRFADATSSARRIVRADLKELVDLDLKGAPYAYAPMGGYDGEKPEMEGFRFWKTGCVVRQLLGNCE
jgi:hypothetical protein